MFSLAAWLSKTRRVGVVLFLSLSTAFATEPSILPPASIAPPPPSADTHSYKVLVERIAAKTGLPPPIADAVMAVESGYDPNAVGAAGEIGLMQVMPSTARMMGFTGTLAELAVPETNAFYGVTYLAQAWHLADRDLCTAVMKYRAGHGETRFSVKSVDYCLAVREKLTANHYPVTGQVPIPTFRERTRSHKCRFVCLAGSSTILPNLALLNQRLSDLAWQTVARASHCL